ncbi:ATP-binding protein [Prauserella sp. PE36]|uniref:histidine kinase n=1 Tax=Prauserella endophytica TaxID=1592324 RepID=A0ABY2S783_9PSEU|nr:MULTISPECIES: ATP-binding protein [Prauserella]PXY30096.1 histidine kinase [Prauserella coralliicola]RBM12636.1 ATP-binding protein [Prauserella sp. PE36]TKG71159.1 sensor histidine kinase [Prauserella endophytica]
MARRARAREFLDRSRVLLDRSRVAAAQFLDPPRYLSERPALEAAPAAPQHDQPDIRDGAPETALVDICASIALRDLNLVDSLLSQLEEMETKEDNHDRLSQLYRLDHLATRLRRNAENLRVLAGRDASETSSETSSLVDTVRAAMSSIDQYSRITIGRIVSLGVVGFAAEDLSRLLAELLDNAANQSPPNSPVRVSAHLTEQGSVLVRIEDEGIGLPPERLRELNDRLSHAPVLDDDAVRHMGLAVVRRLAGRHDMRVTLDRRVPHGTTATVLLPASLVSELPEATWSGTQTVIFAQGGRNHSTPQDQPEPVPSAVLTEEPGAISGELPRRGAHRNDTPSPRPRHVPSSPVVGGTTASGLPRRVSRSLKNPSGEKDVTPAASPADDAESIEAGHDQLLADLGAFSDGEQAARDEQRSSDEADPSSEGKQ